MKKIKLTPSFIIKRLITLTIILLIFTGKLFSMDRDSIYYGPSPIKADTKTLEELSSGFAKDSQHVFYNFKLLENSDAKSFEFINNRFFNNKLAKDDNQIYLIYQDKLLIFDKTRDLGFYFLKDDNVIYYLRNNRNIYQFKPFDIASFKVLNHTYAVDNKNVYYIIQGDKHSIIKEADSASFQVINQILQKDKNHIYHSNKDVYKGKSHSILKDTDNIDLPSFTQINDYFYKDKNYIYEFINSTLQPMKEADIATFTYNEDDDYAKDKNYIYAIQFGYCRKYIEKTDIIEGIDTASYIPLSYSYSKDKYQIYYRYKPLIGADVNTFTLMKTNINYSKDKQSIYYLDKKITGADPNTFNLIKSDYSTTNYGKDNKSVYYYEKEIIGADPDTFDILTINNSVTEYGKDNNSVFYKNNKIIEADPNSFQLKKYNDGRGLYGKDKKAIYLYENKINADNGSFQFLKGQIFAKDKNNIYLITIPDELKKATTLRIIDKKSILKDLEAQNIHAIHEKLLKTPKQTIAIDKIVTPLKMVDINTFQVINQYLNIAIDKNHVYFYKEDNYQHPTGMCLSEEEDWLLNVPF